MGDLYEFAAATRDVPWAEAEACGWLNCADAGGWLRLLPSSALVIEQPDGLRGQILDLVANELLTVETAADEIMRLLHRQSCVHWFIQTAAGERCEKCGLPRAVGKEGQ